MKGERQAEQAWRSLSPDGQRRVFGAANIARVCNQNLKGRDHGAEGRTSIADKPHASRREIERAQRRAMRKGG